MHSANDKRAFQRKKNKLRTSDNNSKVSWLILISYFFHLKMRNSNLKVLNLFKLLGSRIYEHPAGNTWGNGVLCSKGTCRRFVCFFLSICLLELDGEKYLCKFLFCLFFHLQQKTRTLNESKRQI